MSSPAASAEPSSPTRDAYARRTTNYSQLLIAYFRSGWAFFIPYLAVYLLYAWLRWPVNPSTGDDLSAPELRPSLLHVYWAFHAIHLILGIVALGAWWQRRHSGLGVDPRSRLQVPSLWPLLPWLCLALFFWIPGIYLEWPSDPWEHLRRINEWRILDEVTAHSSWSKSSYFLSFSLSQHATGPSQLSWLNLYYTSACLLLSWQYYRLARAAGLSDRASLVFVALHAVTFGNNTFSFHRYYGLSSSILAQLGAVGLTRVALEAARGGTRNAAVESIWKLFNPVPSPLLASVLCLAVLTAFNHIQGLGIAGLGVMAVIAWRLIEWRRAAVIWIAGVAAAASVAVVIWFPRHPALDGIYRPQEWLTWCYGFNFFSLGSPTVERSFQILGPSGVIGLAVGLWLVGRNQVAGWLSWMPIMALATPCIGLPVAHFLAASTNPHDGILVFHRLLFAVPSSLALVTLGQNWAAASARRALDTRSMAPTRPSPVLAAIVPLGLFLALALTPTRGAAARLWQALQRVPDDLQLAHVTSLYSDPVLKTADNDDTLVVTESLGAEIRQVFHPTSAQRDVRQIHGAFAYDELAWYLDRVRQAPRGSAPCRSELRHATTQIPDQKRFALRIAEPDRTAAPPIALGSSWETAAGDAPLLSHSADGKVIRSNPAGAATYMFNSSLIAVDQGKRYRLQATVRQSGPPAAVSFLAVAWYDRQKNLLEANKPSPVGAHSPIGWANGTYSYYGLVGQPASATWSRYETSFGWGEPASIPANAAFVKLGALLNYRETPGAIIELRDLTLRVKPPYANVAYAVPNPLRLLSPRSQTAILSGHWSPQKAAQDHVGLPELRLELAAMLYDRDSIVSAPGGG